MTSLNMAKLKAMVHYIIASVPPEELDITKLNAILWRADREAFLKLGQTISGDTYIRRPEGPVSKNLDAALLSLYQDGAIDIQKKC